MKRFLYSAGFIFSITLLASCSQENPDENFNKFYQGSPQAEKIEKSVSETLEKTEKPPQKGFEFSGEDSEYQCTTTCLPKP
ncbi:hypothetical protein HZA38_06730 [Candidatus Peregrinibacteria bacterium]|nr:hypothetical protein [Candidatus Peregrinibacteria bacterium]